MDFFEIGVHIAGNSGTDKFWMKLIRRLNSKPVDIDYRITPWEGGETFYSENARSITFSIGGSSIVMS
jgi:hypothetical protein